MPSEEQTRLVVHSSGGWPVSDTIEFLQAINSAYSRLLIFETTIEDYDERLRRLRRYLRYPEPFTTLSIDTGSWLAEGSLSDSDLERYIRPRDQLFIERVQLASPGAWEFLGSLNPLEVIRKYLNDRHVRRQDREYREGHERRRLELENLILETEFIQERIALARELGATEAELAPLMNSLVYNPLLRLDALADRGMITSGNPRPRLRGPEE